jgi:hypothetical protein
MPPIIIGTNSCLPNCKRKSSTRFIVAFQNAYSAKCRAASAEFYANGERPACTASIAKNWRAAGNNAAIAIPGKYRADVYWNAPGDNELLTRIFRVPTG